jgi:hypothetical protein
VLFRVSKSRRSGRTLARSPTSLRSMPSAPIRRWQFRAPSGAAPRTASWPSQPYE